MQGAALPPPFFFLLFSFFFASEASHRAKRTKWGPRKVLQSKLFGERRNKRSNIKGFARKFFLLCSLFRRGCGCPAHNYSLFTILYSLRSNITRRRRISLRERNFHANRPFCRFWRHFPALRGITSHQGAPRRGQIEHPIYFHQ